MSYRNKTYVIFDGDKDMWAYAYMKGWNNSERIEFNFYDAHDLRPLTDRAKEETVRIRLRERFANSKQVVVLTGKSTRYLYKFVRWEIEMLRNWTCPSSASISTVLDNMTPRHAHQSSTTGTSFTSPSKPRSSNMP